MITKLNKKEITNIKGEDKVYQYLFNKVLELGKIIIDTKGIEHKKHDFIDDAELELYNIQQDIYYYSIWFESYRTLADQVKYRYEDDVLEEKVKFIIKLYNELIDELTEYKEEKERIEKQGYEKLESELKAGLKDIFCKMLDYKKRKYNKEASLPDLIKELVLCYSDYKWLFDDTYTMLIDKSVYRNTERDDFWTIKADKVEYINNLEFTYKYFSENEDSYKNYTQFYEDITLKEGQTLKDLYYEEKEKFIDLFIEMLNFINIEIPEDKYYTNLEILVHKYYPFYSSNFTIINGTCNYSYIDSIHVLKSNYDYFKRTYKNHKEMLKQYIEDEEEWYAKSKYDDELDYYPEGEKELKELKKQFSKYYENE